MYTGTAILKNKPIAAAPAPTAQPLLDAVGVNAIAALGFKKLRASYAGNCIQVRRQSDLATQDIGFDANGDLDTAAIASFCGASNGQVAIWYDQSGNGYDFNVTNTPQPGSTGTEPIIYFNSAVTTDAAGNIAAYSTNDPSSTSITGQRFLNSPTMAARQAPNITIFGQVNVHNGNGILHTELENGYNFGTYGPDNDGLKIIRSNGNNLITVQTVENNSATDPWAATIFYNDDATGKVWMTSNNNNVSPFEKSAPMDGFNASTYNNCTLFRYYSPSLYQNCALSGYIYWDKPTGVTFTAQELYDLYDWVETNLGYTNNAPTP